MSLGRSTGSVLRGGEGPRRRRGRGAPGLDWRALVRRTAGRLSRGWLARLGVGWDAFGSLSVVAGLGAGGRRPGPRRFQPSFDGGALEPRVVMSTNTTSTALGQYLLTHPSPKVARAHNTPPQYQGGYAYIPHGPTYDQGRIATQTAHGGQSVIVAMPDGSRYRVSLEYAENLESTGLTAQTGNGNTGTIIPNTTGVLQPQGTVRVYPMAGDKVGIITDGNTSQDELVIDPLPQTQRKNYAHSFGYGEAGRTHVLNIGSIQINGGNIQAVLGFHSADLSGPLTIGTGTVDRLAFDAILPGAAIGIGGTLNTLDVLNQVDLQGGPGVSIGGDLNLFNAGGNISLSGGANFLINRDTGAILQPPKGTSTGSGVLALNLPTVSTGITQITNESAVSAYIKGSIVIAPGSVFSIGRKNDQAFYVFGSINGASRFIVGGIPLTAAPALPNGQILTAVSYFNIIGPGLVPSGSSAAGLPVPTTN